MFTRRDAIALGASALIFSPMAANAEMAFPPELILENLKKSVWLSTNRSASQAAYVVAAPWCPYCEQLYEAQAGMQHDIDFRYVFMDFRQSGNAVANAYFSDAEDQVGLFYADRRARNAALSPASAAWLGNINMVAGHRMAPHFGGMFVGTSAGSSTSVGFAYPTVVQKDQAGQVSAILGAWMHLDAIVSTNGDQAADAPDPARYAEIIRSAPSIQARRQNYFASASNTEFFAAPMDSAAVIESLDERQGYPMAGSMVFGGEEWLAAEAFTSGDAMVWARKSELYSG